MEQSQSSNPASEPVILIVSGTCCYPNLAIRDRQAQQVIQQALDETGVKAQVRTVKASSALSGGIPPEIVQSLGLAMDGFSIMRLPGVFIDNRLISLGVPALETIKEALKSTQIEKGN